MALLPDSSMIHLIFQNLKPTAHESELDFLKDIFPVIPGILWVIFAFVLLIRFQKPLTNLLYKVDGFEFQGVKLSFLKDSLDEVINLAKQKNKQLEMAAKDKRWNVSMSDDEKERVLRRAVANKKLLEGARLLWVDDQPENDNNERRMFQQLGVYCDFAQTTQKALALLKDQKEVNYDCIISDMDRTQIGESEKAGIELIWSR